MKKSICLFTDQYPFGKGEQFVENELEYVANRKDIELTVIPSFFGNGIARELPCNVNLDKSLALQIQKHRYDSNILAFLKSTILILKGFVRHKRFCLRALIRIAWFAHNSRIIKKWANQKDLSGKIIYVYWCDFQALGLVELGLSVNSRVHGNDLYIERHNPPFIPYRDTVVVKLHRLFSISEDGKNYLVDHYKKQVEKISVSRLGIKDSNVYSAMCKVEDSIVVVSCAFISDVKRVNLMARALIDFAMQRNENVIWHHFGGGDSQKQSEIDRILCEKPDNLNVSFHGDVSNKCIIEFYQKNYVDVFVNTSSSEGIPVSVMEACSFGIPILACDVGGLKEIVFDNGVLMHKDFSNVDFEKGLCQILANNEYRVNSRKVYEENYNAESNYKEFYNLLGS